MGTKLTTPSKTKPKPGGKPAKSKPAKNKPPKHKVPRSEVYGSQGAGVRSKGLGGVLELQFWIFNRLKTIKKSSPKTTKTAKPPPTYRTDDPPPDWAAPDSPTAELAKAAEAEETEEEAQFSLDHQLAAAHAIAEEYQRQDELRLKRGGIVGGTGGVFDYFYILENY